MNLRHASCDKPGVTILYGGTDGTEGTKKAAGAVVDYATKIAAFDKSIDPDEYIRDFNYYNSFRKTGGHILYDKS